VYSEGLGRIYNLVSPADDVYVSLRDAHGVTFLVHEVDGASVVLITFAADAAGTGSVTPDVVDHYYGKSNDTASGVWHRTAVSPASETFTKADATEDTVAVEISAMQCPDGKPWVKCAVDGSGVVTAVLHDLAIQRTPENLRSVTVA
jgi:hypothetical protein